MKLYRKISLSLTITLMFAVLLQFSESFKADTLDTQYTVTTTQTNQKNNSYSIELLRSSSRSGSSSGFKSGSFKSGSSSSTKSGSTSSSSKFNSGSFKSGSSSSTSNNPSSSSTSNNPSSSSNTGNSNSSYKGFHFFSFPRYTGYTSHIVMPIWLKLIIIISIIYITYYVIKKIRKR